MTDSKGFFLVKINGSYGSITKIEECTFGAGVFYCGAPGLTKELQKLALYFSHKTTTKFDFHKENF